MEQRPQTFFFALPRLATRLYPTFRVFRTKNRDVGGDWGKLVSRGKNDAAIFAFSLNETAPRSVNVRNGTSPTSKLTKIAQTSLLRYFAHIVSQNRALKSPQTSLFSPNPQKSGKS